MKQTWSRTKWTVAAVIPLIGTALAGPIVTNQPASNTEEILPLIQFEDAPLADAIRVLARQMDLNHILDPRIVARADRRSESTITVRWRNITGREALQRVLKDHQLTIVTNAATSVARIV